MQFGIRNHPQSRSNRSIFLQYQYCDSDTKNRSESKKDYSLLQKVSLVGDCLLVY